MNKIKSKIKSTLIGIAMFFAAIFSGHAHADALCSMIHETSTTTMEMRQDNYPIPKAMALIERVFTDTPFS